MTPECAARLDEYTSLYGEADLIARLERSTPPSVDVFVRRLYTDLDEAASTIQAQAQTFKSKDENALRNAILNMLRAWGYLASAETDNRGHVDLLVRSIHRPCKWIGEAKVHRDYAWLRKGLEQLLTRYTDGTEAASALIVFVFVKNAAAVAAKWAEYVGDRALCDLRAGPSIEGPLRFRTVHEHTASGLQVETRHMMVPMYYRPSA